MFTLATLSTFLDSLEEGVLFLDRARRVVAVNEAATRMLGRNQEAVLDRLCPTIFAGSPCAQACESRGDCTLMPSKDMNRKVQDIDLHQPDGLSVCLRMWALLLPENKEGLYCGIILRDRSREIELEDDVRERMRLGGIVGHSPAIQTLYKKIMRAATSDATVLITGESGTGKELVARALHDNSSRSKGPYIAVHCAALPENLLESELFGHVRGAFTGASAARVGRFEAAHGGTLLLDEVGEIPLSVQVKLLRVIQEREIVRLGENHTRPVDVRVIAATHRDLTAMVRNGEFREDLYYRLCVLPLEVPALRERQDDVIILANKILADLAKQYKQETLRFSQQTLLVLEAYNWPGNVRQLANAIEYAIVHCDTAVIEPLHLPDDLHTTSENLPNGEGEMRVALENITRYYQPAARDEDEMQTIQRVLRKTGGNKAETARRLGMSRTTLWKKLKLNKEKAEHGQGR